MEYISTRFVETDMTHGSFESLNRPAYVDCANHVMVENEGNIPPDHYRMGTGAPEETALPTRTTANCMKPAATSYYEFLTRSV